MTGGSPTQMNVGGKKNIVRKAIVRIAALSSFVARAICTETFVSYCETVLKASSQD